MNFRIALDRRLYGPAGGRRHLWARIEVPRSETRSRRAPLDIALVLDRSGSMSGSKIELAKQASALAVNLLRETDRCALVGYDDEITLAARVRPVDAAQRAALRDGLAALYARGSTNLFGGWMAGAEEISEAADGQLRRVLLLTDGLANVGVTEPAQILHHVRELALRGVGTSTFGVGLDFDEVLVSGMAEAGNGHFYYIERPEQIPDYLSSELGELLTVVGRNAAIAITVSSGASVLNLNKLPMLGALYQLGDLSEGAVIDVCFELLIRPEQSGPLRIEAALTWRDAQDGSAQSVSAITVAEAGSEDQCRAEPPNREAVGQAIRARAARVRTEALKLNRSGTYDEAQRVSESELAVLREMAADYPEGAEEIERLAAESLELSAPMTAMRSKAMTFDAYTARRSRTAPK